MSDDFDAAGFLAERLERIAAERPLIHHITNFVVMNETANLTLCLGASPVMAHAAAEVEEMAAQAGALVINMGTPYPELEEAMCAAGRAANRAGVPVILDPVGAGATAYRTRLAHRLLEEVRFAAVRGNAAEIARLAGEAAEIRGVDSLSFTGDATAVASVLASSLGCVVAVTGAVDVVSDGSRLARVSNGHELLGMVTGTGCMATTAIAVLLAGGEPHLEAAASALALFGLAGELAAAASGGLPGSFHAALYDQVYRLSSGRAPLEDLRVTLESVG
ncbi:MAG: hydroxyethylthiazole kinase [Actinomycetota bacterium]|nr:hydroxyethylthiazole kinase [Actinomycetota bacterium]